MWQTGLGWGLLAALAYATMNLCLRAVSIQADPLFGAMVRAVPICLLGWALVAWGSRRRRARWPGWRALAPLLLVGFLFNVTGNGSYQYALAQAGLTLTVPVSQGAVLWGGALAGWWLMRERVTRRMGAGLAALVLALPFLTANVSVAVAGPIWLAVLAAIVAGLSYGSGNAVMRQTVIKHGLTQGVALAAVATSGLACLLVLVLARLGPAVFIAVEGPTLLWLLIAGGFNAVALGSLSRALLVLPVARVNALSTLQTAISALGGVLLFAEPLTGVLLIGLGLSLAGTVLVQRGRRGPLAPGPDPATSTPARAAD